MPDLIRELEAVSRDDDPRGAALNRIAQLREEGGKKERIFQRAGEMIMLRAAAISSQNGTTLIIRGKDAITIHPTDLQKLVAAGLREALEDLE